MSHLVGYLEAAETCLSDAATLACDKNSDEHESIKRAYESVVRIQRRIKVEIDVKLSSLKQPGG